MPSTGTRLIGTASPSPAMEKSAGQPFLAVPSATATSSPTAKTSAKEAPVVSTKKGDTVASVWTSVTGMPWKKAKELGLTDGSYANNIEILRGLKSGRITKDSVNAMMNGEGVTTEQASYAPGYYPAPTIAVPAADASMIGASEPVPEAAPVMESGTPYTRAMSYGGRIYGYDPIWDIYYG